MADVALAIQGPPPTGKSFAKGGEHPREKPFARVDEIPHLLPKMRRHVKQPTFGTARLNTESAEVVAACDTASVRVGRTTMG